VKGRGEVMESKNTKKDTVMKSGEKLKLEPIK